MNVAKSELILATPIFAKIAVRAAKPADSNAQKDMDWSHEQLIALFQVIAIDVVLAGDNAIFGLPAVSSG